MKKYPLAGAHQRIATATYYRVGRRFYLPVRFDFGAVKTKNREKVLERIFLLIKRRE